jgi:L-arabinose transport system substrate-binding protein
MKLLPFVALCIFGILGCSGTNQGKQEALPIKIGFLVKSGTEVWFRQEWKFAEDASKTLGFDLVELATPDAGTVMSAIDNLHTQGAQGLIICSPDVKLGPAIVEKAKQFNMKLLTVDDRLVGPDGQPLKDVAYLGISAENIGKMVGQAIVDEIKQRGWNMNEVGALATTVDELETARQRTDGAKSVLLANGFPEKNIFETPWKNRDIKGALDVAAVTLTQHPEIKKWVAYSMNDDGVLGTVRACEGRGIPASDVIGVGINGTSGVDDFRKSGPTGFFASVLLSPRRHGYGTAEMMFNWIKNGVVPPLETFTDGILITRENYKEQMHKEGLL